MTEDDQYQLGFNGEFEESMRAMRGRLSGIDSGVLALADGSPAELSPNRWRNACECVMSIYSRVYFEPTRYCQAAPQDLMATARLGRSAWYQALADVEATGLVTREPDRCHRTGARRPDRLQIDYEMLADYRDESDRKRAAARRQRLSGAAGLGRTRPTLGRTRPTLGRTRPTLGQHHTEETQEPKIPITNNPPPIPALSSDADRLNGVVGWEEVFETLEAIGLVLGPVAIAAARNAGAEPSDVAELVGVWQDHQTPKPPAWDQGALYARLMLWRPGQSALACWPKWHPDHVRARQRIERDARDRRDAELLTAKRREHEAHAASAVADRQAIGELEAIARAMAHDKYSALLATIQDPAVRARARRDRFSSFALLELSDALNQRRTCDGASV